MDRLATMALFVRVIESGSFSAAARDLSLGQPAVSKAIAALEARLGVRLLVRSTRRLSATDAGQTFYERARRVIDEAEEAENATRGEGATLEGRLRVCAPVTFTRLHVVPRLGSFLAAHPKLRLEMILDDRNVDLLQENIDVALRLGPLADSALTARRIASSDRMVVASVDYIARCGEPLTPAELAAHDAVIYTQGAGGDEWRFHKGTSEISVRTRGRVSFSAAEGIREGVKAGLGIAIVSRWMVAPELDMGSVKPLLEDWRLSPVDLWSVFPSGRLPTARARAFVAWLENEIDL